MSIEPDWMSDVTRPSTAEEIPSTYPRKMASNAVHAVTFALRKSTIWISSEMLACKARLSNPLSCSRPPTSRSLMRVPTYRTRLASFGNIGRSAS